VASGGKLYAATLSGLFTAAQSPNPSWTQLSPGPGNNTLDMGGIQSVVVESPTALVVAVVVKIGLPHKLVVGAKLSGPSRLHGFIRISYQWLRNGKAIRHATHRTYKITKADLGKKISLRLTLTPSTGKKIVVTTRAVKIPKPKPKRRKHH
jgi:arabinogalactan endo-1,4-beta-galactosidase